MKKILALVAVWIASPMGLGAEDQASRVDPQTEAGILGGIAIAVYVGLHLAFHFIRKSKVRKRKAVLAILASELGLELTPEAQSPSNDEFKRDFNEARGDGRQPCAIHNLYRGSRGQRTLTLFEFSRWSGSSKSRGGGLTEGIAAGLETLGFGYLLFGRSRKAVC